MSWKTELQLVDLGRDQKLEVSCKTCNHTRYENPYLLCTKMGFAFEYLDEVERSLTCHNPSCRSAVRISIASSQDTEGFIGGLA